MTKLDVAKCDHKTICEFFPRAKEEAAEVARFGAEKYKDRGLVEDGHEISVAEYSRHAADHHILWRLAREDLDIEELIEGRQSDRVVVGDVGVRLDDQLEYLALF